MRSNVKKRLIFLSIAIVVYSLGFNFLPETLPENATLSGLTSVILASFAYFLLLPVLYWVFIIKGNQQKPWKLLLIFSLSGACARFSFPESIAIYFEFLMWVKYPIIAIVVLFELYLMVTIIRGIWGARKSSGDPRLHTLKTYADDEKKLTAGLPFAWEPASWYYAIPRFSRNHLPTLANIQLTAASRFNYLLSISALLLAGAVSYMALVDWSEIAAIFVACFILYSSVFLSARHRVARRFSLYQSGEQLIINGSFWGLGAFNFLDIESVELTEAVANTKRRKQNKEETKTESQEPLVFGKISNQKNLKLTFKHEQIYHGVLGQFPEKFREIYLNIDDPESASNEILALIESATKADDEAA